MKTTIHALPRAALVALLALAACGKTKTEYVEVTAPESTYLVEVLPGMMGAAVGKSEFQLRVRNRADSTPASGLTISIKPVMYMADMNHSAPADVVTESSEPGTYDCAIYFQMMSGVGMGYWEVTATIGTGAAAETAVFYPSVGMAMGTDTVRKNLWGVSDVGSTATATTKYVLFADGPLTEAEGQLHLHLSRAEDMMMTFRPVHVGAALAGTTGTVTSVSLTASATATFTTPIAATDAGHGHWTLDLSSLELAAGAQTTVYLELQVNGEDKTTDGLVVSGTNAYVDFKVTPR